MKRFGLLIVSLLLCACSTTGPIGVSSPVSSPASLPAAGSTHPRALPLGPPNNIFDPSSPAYAGLNSTSASDPSGGASSVPAAPSTPMPQSPQAVPPPGAEDKAISLNPVPDPSPDHETSLPIAGAGSAVNCPVAIPVPGHPGLVYSPFTTENQLVDVSAYPPGSKVKCPYSGRQFLTPTSE